MISKILIAASTKPVILSILISGEDYGYEIIYKVREISGGVLDRFAWIIHESRLPPMRGVSP